MYTIENFLRVVREGVWGGGGEVLGVGIGEREGVGDKGGEGPKERFLGRWGSVTKMYLQQ